MERDVAHFGEKRKSILFVYIIREVMIDNKANFYLVNTKRKGSILLRGASTTAAAVAVMMMRCHFRHCFDDFGVFRLFDS